MIRTDECCSVLVVEDEALIRLCATDALEAAGLSVLSAGNAQEAVDTLRCHPEIEVVFTDINMPGAMDGLALAKLVCRKWPRIALIITSGRLPPPIANQIPAGGRFFSKPYDLAALIAAIKGACVP